jgi:hypothetical protein
VANVPLVEIIHGIKGTTSIYNPKVDKGQSSSGHLFVQNAFTDATNKIVVGWHVSFNYSIMQIFLLLILKPTRSIPKKKPVYFK